MPAQEPTGHSHDPNCNANHITPEAFTKHMEMYRARAMRELMEDDIHFTQGCLMAYAGHLAACTILAIVYGGKPSPPLTENGMLSTNQVKADLMLTIENVITRKLVAAVSGRPAEDDDEEEFA